MHSQSISTTGPGSSRAVVGDLPPNAHEKQRDYGKIVGRLGITEIALGCACIILEIVVLALLRLDHPDGFRFTNTITNGGGISGGIWVIIAGSLGMASERPNATRCLVNTHMAFSIIGAISSGSLMITEVFLGVLLMPLLPIRIVAILYTLGFLFFALFVLLIVSASYCCRLVGCCGQNNQSVYVQQIGMRSTGKY